MSPKSRSKRCSSPGILLNSKNANQALSQSRCSKKLKIRVHDPSRPTEHEEAEEERRKFEELKKRYFDKCAYVNKNLVLRCTQPVIDYCDDDPNMQVLKTIRGNGKTLDFSKTETTRNHQEAEDVRKRNSKITNVEAPPSNDNRRSVKRGCGAVGCDCLNCVCGVNCQQNCQCMRKI